MSENKSQVDLVQINKATSPPYVFDLSIKMSNLTDFDIRILEHSLDKMYELQEKSANNCPPIVEIAGQKFTKEQVDTLYRWDSLKFLRDALRTEIENKIFKQKVYPIDYSLVNPMAAKPYS